MPPEDERPALEEVPAELVAALLRELGRSFDLATCVDDHTLGDAVRRRLEALDSSDLPTWGDIGSMIQVARKETEALEFYYRPHLFPEMSDTLRLGHQLQFDLLPRSLPGDSALRIAAVLESYCHLSGDLLGWRQEADSLVLWIADTSGHGIRAGLAAAVFYFLVNNVEPGLHPRQFAGRLNDSLLGARSSSDPRPLFVSAFIARIGRDGRGAYASAGHHPALVRRAGGALESLPATGIPLGLMPGQTFDELDVAIERGDTLLLYTDGLIEATDQRGEEFGAERLESLLASTEAPPLETARTLYHAVNDFKGVRSLDDDLTFLVSQRTDP